MLWLLFIALGSAKILQFSVLKVDPDRLHILMLAQNVLLEYHYPYCKTCVTAPSVLDYLAAKLPADSPLILASLDCNNKESEKDQFIGDLGTFTQLLEQYKLPPRLHLPAKKLFSHGNLGHPLDDACTPGYVFRLSPETFDSVVSNGTYFVKFFSPHCLTCRSLAPVWSEVAANLINESRVCIAELDCTTSVETCERLHATRVPSLLWFRGGKEGSRYSGWLEASRIQSFVAKMLNQAESQGNTISANLRALTLPTLLYLLARSWG